MRSQYLYGWLLLAIMAGHWSIPAQASTPNDQIQIQQFIYASNTVFSQADLNQVTRPWRNRPLTFAEMSAVKSAILQHYEQAGYIGTVVTIPVVNNQNLNADQATVTIRVTEGRLDEVITNSSHNRRWIVQRLMATGPLHQRDLLTQLQVLRLSSAISSIQAELRPTGVPGKHQLQLNVVDAPKFSVVLGSHNHRSPDSGKLGGQLQATWHNPIGWGDQLQVSGNYSAGGPDWLVNYQLPISTSGKTQLNFDYRQSSQRIMTAPLRSLDLTTQSRQWRVGLKHNVQQSLSAQALVTTDIGSSMSGHSGQSTLLGRPFPLSADSDDDGRTGYTALRLWQTHQRRSDRAAVIAQSQFNLGTDRNFFSWRGQTLLNQPIGSSRLLVQGTMQLGSANLPIDEQLSLGGHYSIRGFRNHAVLGSSGLNGSVELQFPLRDGLALIPFIDGGLAWSQKAPAQALTATGLGLQWQTPRFNARLNYAIPLFTSLDQSSWSGHQCDFSVSYRYVF